jgi:NAD(P)-dependent dehydrogenase (short-subunit alcohol dehydrogenase family)
VELNGVAAIVTGGASGLGEATARMLANRGARVAVFDLNAEQGRKTAADIGGVFVEVNVSDDTSMSAGIAAAEEVHGVARVLVNCAGVAPASRIVDKRGQAHPLDLFRKTIEVNLIGTFNAISKFSARVVAADFKDEEAGVIVNTASIAAYDGQIGQSAYSASKGGVVALTLQAARDLSQNRIRVVTIAPGIFLTPMLMGLPQQVQDSLGAQVPHPSRLGKPEEYARMVDSIIANPMLNGEVIRLDGSLRMALR